jgi:hypothetical protein
MRVSRQPRKVLEAIGVGLAIALAGCGADASGDPAESAAKAGPVAAALDDYSIKLVRDGAPSGDTTFEIRNDGAVLHEFVILRTDHAHGDLPKEGDEVSEHGAGELVDEAEDIGAGTSVRLTVTLEPGRYVVLCNLSGHYDRGMHAAFRVT